MRVCALVDRVPESARDELRVTRLRRQAEQCGGDLRVEHRRRHGPARLQQHLEVLPRGVQDLELAAVGKHCEQRPEIEARQRVDEIAVGIARDLHQAQLRAVGALAHEFGVHREARCALQPEYGSVQLPWGRHQRGVAHASGNLRVESRHPRRRVRDVQQFLRIFLDIVLWRRGPQDLPVSGLLLGLTVAAYVAVSAAQLALLGETAATWLFFVIVDPLLLAAWTWLVLRIYGRTERFTQTATAVFGASALLGFLVYLPIQVLLTAMEAGPESGLAQLLALALVVVFALVTGRILKLATETNMITGVAIALTYFLLVNLLVGLLRGPVT